MDDIAFALDLASLPTQAAVFGRLLRQSSALGFPIIALGRLPTPDYPFPDDFVLSNWPEAWVAEYFEQGHGHHDPVRIAAGLMSQPFTLAEPRQGKAAILPSPKGLAMMDAARKHGCDEGLIVPIFGAHGARGLVCFFTSGPEPGARDRIILEHVAIHGYRRLYALHRAAQPEAPSPETLTPREIAVLRAARDGHRDVAIAALLSISVRTVRFHYNNARRKLGTGSRAEALVRAVNLHLL